MASPLRQVQKASHCLGSENTNSSEVSLVKAGHLKQWNSNINSRGRILGRNWDKSLQSFPPYQSQSPLLADFTPLLLEQKWFETGLWCEHCIVHWNLKSKNSQDNAQKPLTKLCVYEFGFWSVLQKWKTHLGETFWRIGCKVLLYKWNGLLFMRKRTHILSICEELSPPLP